MGMEAVQLLRNKLNMNKPQLQKRLGSRNEKNN